MRVDATTCWDASSSSAVQRTFDFSDSVGLRWAQIRNLGQIPARCRRRGGGLSGPAVNEAEPAEPRAGKNAAFCFQFFLNFGKLSGTESKSRLRAVHLEVQEGVIFAATVSYVKFFFNF